MIITKDIAENRHNIPNLFNLRDDLIDYHNVVESKIYPDYFNFDKYKAPYFFEPKGRKSNPIGKRSNRGIPEIDKIKSQLLNVHIDIKWRSRERHLNWDVRKHIVQSLFTPSLRI